MKFTTYLLLIFILLISQNIKSQELDSAQIDQVIEKSRKLYINRQYDSSNYYIDQVIDQVSVEYNFKQFFHMQLIKMGNLTNSREFEKSENLGVQLKEILASKVKRKTSQSVNIDLQFGDLYEKQGQLKKANEYYYSALEEAKFLKDKISKIKIADIQNTIGINYAKRGIYELAKEFIKKSYKFYESNNDSLYLLQAANNLGNLYQLQSKFDRAIEYHKQSLEIRTNLLGHVNPRLAISQLNLGDLYALIGQYNLAIEYYRRAINLKEKGLGKDYVDKFDDYSTLGNILLNTNKDSLAERYLNQSKTIAGKIKNRNPAEYAMLLVNLGKFHKKQSDFNQAINYLNESLKYFEKGSANNVLVAINAKIDLGELLLLNGNDNQGLNLLDEVVLELVEINGEKHDRLIKVYNILTDYYNSKGLIDSAIYFNNKSIKSNIDLSINKIDFQEITDKTFLLKSLSLQCDLIISKTQNSNKVKTLKNISNNMILGDSLIQELFQTNNYLDQLKLSESINTFYDNAIKLEYELYTHTRAENHLKSAFYYAEKSKGILLQRKLRALQEQKLGSIPLEILKKENELKEDIAYLESELYNINHSEDVYDSLKASLYNDRLFLKKRSFDSLVLIYQDEYPNYFSINYSNNTLSTENIQLNLNQKQQVLHYTNTPKSIYLISITKGGKDLYKINKGASYDSLINDFISLNINPESSVADFDNISNLLYNKIIGPLNTLKENLIIIPDGNLNLIPFETLIAKQTREISNFSELNYLIYDHQISYANSASIIFNDAIEEIEGSNVKLLAIAPSYNNQVQSQDSLRSSFGKLIWNKNEIESISSHYSNTSLIYENANESSFRSLMNDKDIIHIASHGIIDDKEPLFSRIALENNPNDSINDDYLFVHELFNLSLDAKMVVLSACNTASGEIVNGEGVLSLGRGFAYAGVPSLVVSHWQVDDQSTSILMNLFYKFLSEGNSKSSALRTAKLQYLKQASPTKSHPFFWGAFVVIGQDHPIYESNSLGWVWYILGLVFAVIIIIMVRKRLS